MNNEPDNWQLLHGKLIDSFLLLLNTQTDQFVLKGETAYRFAMAWIVFPKTSI